MTSFDPFAWVHDRLTASHSTWLVAPELDAKINRYPALIWALSVGNPNDLGIWRGNLTLNLLCEVDGASDAIQAVQATVLAWQTPGPVQSVTLQTLTQSPSSDVAETIKQYTFIYSLTWDL